MIDKTQRLYESLDSFLTEYKEKNEGNKYRPVAVGRYGIRTRESIYSKELAKDYSKNKLIFKNTLTVGMGSTQIDIGVLSDDATYAVSPAYHTYRINGINSDYLRYCLECRNQDMFVRYVKRGSRQGKSIDLKRWITYKIPVYPESVQAEIVKRLDSVKAILSFREQELNALDELIKARFVEMFGHPDTNEKGWKMNTFGDICTVRQGLQIPISKRLTEYDDDCYEYITVQYLHGGKEREYIKSPKATVICTKDDILMTRTGNTGLVVTGVEGVFHNNFFLIDFDRNRYDKDFLVQYLNLDTIQADILRRAGTSTIPDLNHGEFYKIPVFEPLIGVQHQFKAFLKQVDKSKLLSGCRFFHSWVPANRDNLNHVGVPRRRPKSLRRGRRQHAHLHH